MSVHVSGGLGLPMGDGLENAKVGPAFIAGLSYALTETAAIVAEGQYSRYTPGEDAGVPEGLDTAAKMTGANLGAMLLTSPENKARANLHLGLGLFAWSNPGQQGELTYRRFWK